MCINQQWDWARRQWHMYMKVLMNSRQLHKALIIHVWLNKESIVYGVKNCDVSV